MRRVSLEMWLVVCCFFLPGGNPLAAQIFIDLSPPGVSPSSAESIDAGQAVRTGQLVGSGLTLGRYHAFYWKSFSAASAVDLNPFGYLDSYGTAVSGNLQVGYGTSSTDSRSHALIWRGSAATAARIEPFGFDRSSASDVVGTEAVGTAYLPIAAGGGGHAMRWPNLPLSSLAIDLHSPVYAETKAEGTSGTHQVGSGVLASGGSQRALLWSGTAASLVDLHPASGYSGSIAHAVSGNEQAGIGFITGSNDYHALLWHGSAASALDLNPAGFNHSEALGTNGINQVGFAHLTSTGLNHAMLWMGAADNYLDLQNYVPAMYPESVATDIDAQGNISGWVYDANKVQHAVMWLVPEPGLVAMMLVPALALGLRRQRQPRPDILIPGRGGQKAIPSQTRASRRNK